MGVEGGTVSGLPEVLENDFSGNKSLSRKILAAGLLMASGIAGRVAFQHLPSVEPLLPAAIATGFLFGRSSGFASGFTGFTATNFLVWGGQGPWSLFQAFGAGIAGSTGSYFSGISDSKFSFFGSMIAGTLIYELIVNAGSLLYMPGIALVGALPFIAVHLASSIAFGSIIYGFRTDIRQLAKR